MTRRHSGNMNGERFLGNRSKKEVHDLDNEQTAGNGCQVDEVIRAGNDVPFNSLASAKQQGYDPCDKCLPGSRR